MTTASTTHATGTPASNHRPRMETVMGPVERRHGTGAGSPPPRRTTESRAFRLPAAPPSLPFGTPPDEIDLRAMEADPAGRCPDPGTGPGAADPDQFRPTSPGTDRPGSGGPGSGGSASGGSASSGLAPFSGPDPSTAPASFATPRPAASPAPSLDPVGRASSARLSDHALTIGWDPDIAAILSGLQVLLVTTRYAPELTGIGGYTADTAGHLAQVTAGVTVLTGLPRHPAGGTLPGYRRRLRVRSEQDGEIRVVRLPHAVAPPRPAVPGTEPRAARRPSTVLAGAGFTARAITFRARPRAGVVVGVLPGVESAVVADRLAARQRLPLVMIVNDLPARPGRVERALLARALHNTDQVVICAEGLRLPIAALGVPPQRIRLVPSWAPAPPAPLSRDEARAALGWPTDRFLTVHTGAMGPGVDLGTVVDAARLLADRPHLGFALIGDGPERARLEQSAWGLPNLRFTDPLPPAEHALALAAADLVLVTERPDALSTATSAAALKVSAYLGAGRPVLAALPPGSATAALLADTAGAAFLVAPGQPAALARAVLDLQASPQRRQSMADAALLFARTALDRGRALAEIEAAIADAVDPLIPADDDLYDA